MNNHRTKSATVIAIRRRRFIGAGRVCVPYALIACAWPIATYAQLHITPYVASQAEYDSNVFDLSSPGQAVIENGETKRDDTVLRNMAGVTGSYQIGLQKLHGTVEGRRFNYEHFTQLDHDEYLLDGGLKWALSNELDGAVDFRQERSMESFADRNTSQLALQLDRAAGTGINLMLTPEWLLQSGIKTHQLDAPIQGAPSFELSENSANVAANYVGFQAISAGLYAEYLRGQYKSVPGADTFDQATLDVTSTYSVSGLSDISVKLGYSQRKDQTDDTGSVSGYTGSLSYTRKLTGKTAARVELFRRISSYTAGADSVFETGGSAGLNWQATYKIMASLDYALTNSNFQGTGQLGSINSNRRDQYQFTTLKVTYQALQWLWVEPFASYENRHSNVEIDGYNATIIGADIRISFGDPVSVKPGTQ